MTEPDEPRISVVENEIARHDPLRCIGIHMPKVVTRFAGAKADVGNFLIEEIAKESQSLGPPRLFGPDPHAGRYSAETGESCSVFAPGSRRSAHGPGGMLAASSVR